MAAAPNFAGHLAYMTRSLHDVEDFSTAQALELEQAFEPRIALPRSIFSKTLAKELKAKTIRSTG
jgi:hypothetical protein